MPEGDSIAILARALSRALLSRTIEQATSRVVEVDAARLVGATVTGLRTHGKNLMLDLSNGLTLHAHLLMNGRIKLRPPKDALAPGVRLAFRCGDVELLASCQVLRLIGTERLRRDPRLTAAGPDPLKPTHDAEVVLARLRQRGAQPIGVAILDQRVLAGIGNALKSELLFLAGADPFASVAMYGDAALRAVVGKAAEVLRLTAAPRLREDRGFGRMTRRTGDALRGGSRLWVYRRAGRPCLVCGAAVAVRRQGDAARATYFCPTCQPERSATDAPLTPPRTH